jgi:hypothetical protein
VSNSTCRSCQAPLLWATTPKNRRIPLDPVPHPEGNVVVLDGVAVVGGEGDTRYRSHFATCPGAGVHRRPR